MELTYEDLKDILEMSGVFDSHEAGEIVEKMRDYGYSSTIGGLFDYVRNYPFEWHWTATEMNALIEAHRQYTSGKLEESAEACPSCGEVHEVEI